MSTDSPTLTQEESAELEALQRDDEINELAGHAPAAAKLRRRLELESRPTQGREGTASGTPTKGSGDLDREARIAPCQHCGKPTPFQCADCAIDKRPQTHVCADCQRQHACRPTTKEGT